MQPGECDLGWPWPAAARSRISVPRLETEARPRQREHQILATRPPGPVVSDKVSFGERNFNKEMESSETSEVFIRRKKVCVDRLTQVGSEKELNLWGSLNHLYGDSSSGFPLANHLALPGSESIFGLTQGPPLCACAFLSQDGFQRKGFWEVDRTYYGLAPPPFSDL